MKKLNVYLVRHGQTYYNIYNKLQGWSNSPLTQKGMQDARNAGEKLAKIHEVIESRKKEAEQLPALKLPVGESEDQVSPSADIYPTDGYLGLYLESYEQNELHFVIRNGRKEAFPGIGENGLNANVSEVKIIDLRSQEEVPLLSPRYGYGGACAGENIGEGYVTPESLDGTWTL